MLRSVCLETVLPGVSAVRSVHSPSFKYRKTARGSSFGVLPRQVWRYDVSMGRTFQREVGRRYGFDLGLEDRILLASLGQKHRRLDDKKMKQLNYILGMKIEEAASGNENVARLSVQFDKIKVNSSFTEAAVYWICNGINDEEVKTILEQEKHSLRRALSDAVGANCADLRFVADKTVLMSEEMDKLFKKADYGVDYRTLSHTARVLGNVDDSPTKVPKVKPPPAWKQQLLKKRGLV